MPEGLNLHVKEYNTIVDLPIGSMALIQSLPLPYDVVMNGGGMFVFNGRRRDIGCLPTGMYVNMGSLDVLSPNGLEIITLQKVTDYYSFLLAGDASQFWCISTTEVVGILG